MSACPRGMGVPASSFLLWGMAGDIPKLLGTSQSFWGTSQSCSVQVHTVTTALYPNPHQGEQGCAPTVGEWPVGPGVGGHCFQQGQETVWLPGEGWGQWADETEGLQGGQRVLGGSPGSQRDPQSCPHPQELTPAGRGQRDLLQKGQGCSPCQGSPCPLSWPRDKGSRRVLGHPRQVKPKGSICGLWILSSPSLSHSSSWI